MALLVNKDLQQGTITVVEYNVILLLSNVGEGLTRLFASSQYEASSLDAVSTTLGATFGIFLRKAYVISKFHKDCLNETSVWPQEVKNNDKK
jgi:hypothetical protein